MGALKITGIVRVELPVFGAATFRSPPLKSVGAVVGAGTIAGVEAVEAAKGVEDFEDAAQGA